MDKEQAKRIIKDTFETSFNKEKFIYFIMNLLNLKQSDIENTSFGIRQGYNIPEMFRPYISKFQRIAKYLKDDNRIDVLIVYLKKDTSIEYARSMQRNFIAGYLKGNYGSDKSKDAALVAFVSPDKEDWRFSLVKVDYIFDKSGKVIEEKSPARRWSFLVGKNESSHTAQSRLVHILADDQYNPTFTQLEEAFNIEKVTKEFFLKYRNLFLRIKEELDKVVTNDLKVKRDFEEKGINTVNFAKKLLGQIIFLYFLQKKGWFGVSEDKKWGEGDKNFIRNLFLECSQKRDKNFFNDYLEYLFYDALNNNNRKSADPAYYNKFNCKIPFLNGGLFEPIGSYDWVHTDINLSNKLFSNRNDNYEGNGVLDIFDLFNFTVKEDEPLEKEVAIDPELLGKIYEKFNAIRTDNYEEYKKTLKSGSKGEENKFNKKFGVYYTPREIVHYMCQQSLINYLYTVVNQELVKQPVRAPKQIKLVGPADPEQLGFHTDKEIVSKKAIEELIKYGEQFTENEEVALIKEQRIKHGKQKKSDYKLQLPAIRKNAKVINEKLKDIRVCDPAVGSGAFSVGMMAEIVKTRNVLSAYIKEQNRTPYNFKRECIEKSLYGVDIDPGAVEIAKLRLWLSLIVDEENITKIRPLPNLDYKIMQGNSLISEFMGIDLDNDKQNNENAILFSIDKTKELYEMLKVKKDELLNQPNINKKKILKKEIENLIIKIFEVKLQEQKSDYFKKSIEIEEKYERHPVKEEREREIKREKDVLSRKTGFNLEEAEKQLRQYTSNQKIRPFFPWKLYFSEVFQEKNGFDVVIANPPYVRQEKIKDQKLLLKKQGYEVYDSTSDLYTYFYERGYHILKPKGFSCFISSNKWMRAKYGKKLRSFFKRKTTLKQIVDFNGYQVFDATVDTDILLFQKTKPSGNIVHILNIQPDFTPSTDIADYFNFHKIEIKQSDFDSNCFILIDKMILNLKKKIEEKGIPLKNWDVGIYRGITTGLNEVFIVDEKTKNELVKRDKNSLEILKPILRGRDINKWYYEFKGFCLIYAYTGIAIKKYQAIYEYLKQYKSKLEQVWEAKYGKKKWYELRGCGYYEEFEKEKIVWADIGMGNSFSFDDKNIFLSNTGYILTGKNLKYLLAVINSLIQNFYFKQISQNLGEKGYRYIYEFVEQLPIPKISESDQKPFIDFVDKIFSLTQSEDYLENPQKQTKVKECERQIDQMVYKLYDLTEEEIKIVEEDK